MSTGDVHAVTTAPSVHRPSYRPTSARTRAVSMAAYTGLLLAWTWLVGLPSDPGLVVLWLWAGTVAWNISAERRYHLHFVRDWSLPVAALLVYFLTRGLATHLGIPVHERMPIEVDRRLFGGTTPTEYLQERLCGLPCLRTAPRWYDVVLTTVYASHFVVGLTLAGVLWVRDRAEWIRWMRRYLTLTFAALAIYTAYPMAPPWLAALHGGISPGVQRINTLGWNDLGVQRISLIMAGMSNPVAAMPSLHAGVALLVAMYAVGRLRSPWRWLLWWYPLVMGFALVYFAEHYVVDVLAGWALAIVVAGAWRLWERPRPVPDVQRQRALTPRSR